MNNNKLKINGIILSGLIIIISFVYAINIQPKVIGDSENLKVISEEIINDIENDNPILCNHKDISNDLDPEDNNRVYCCSNHNDIINLFYLNNILRIISNCMVNMNNLCDFRDINRIYLDNWPN